MRNDVVNNGCIHSASSLGALSAEWLSQEMISPQLPPALGVVETVPLRTLAPLHPLWLVIRTPSLTGQRVTPRMSAGSHGPIGHSYHLRRQKKSHGQQPRISALVIGRGSKSTRPCPYPRCIRVCTSGKRLVTAAPLSLASHGSVSGCAHNRGRQATHLSLSVFYHVHFQIATLFPPMTLS